MAKEKPRSLYLEEEESPEEVIKRTNYLLVIGIDAYAHCPELYNCVKDAKDFIKVLTERYRFDAKNLTTLFDEKATRENVYNAFYQMAEKITSKDNLIVYFSGHGEYNKTMDRGFWIPVNAKQGYLHQYFNNSEIKDLLSSIESHHTFLISDSCFSGSLFASRSRNNKIRRYERDPSRWGLTAGRNEIVSDGKPGDNSPFSESLLNELRNADKSIGVQELCARVTEHVQTIPNSKQSPVGEPLKVDGHQNGQFVFHLKQNAAGDWKKAQGTDTLVAYQAFIKMYPQDARSKDAKKRMQAIKATTAWTTIENAPDTELSQIISKLKKVTRFVRQHSDLINIDAADELGEYLEDKQEFLEVKNSHFKLRRFSRKKTAFREKALNLLKKKEKDIETQEEQEDVIVKENRPSVVQNIVETKIAEPSVPDNMVLVKGGSFPMGDTFGDKEEIDEFVHEVTLSDFRMGKYAVTFEEYDLFCKASKKEKPEDEGWGRGKRPVINVSWADAIEYCNWLSEQQGYSPLYIRDKEGDYTIKKGVLGYRLPTEAEWEYAAGYYQGKKSRFGNGKDIADPQKINFDSPKYNKEDYSVVGEYRGKTVEVGSLNSPNGHGLHDLSGNVWEWCNDWYGAYSKSLQRNPTGTSSGLHRVIRGGSWLFNPQDCRVSYRGSGHPSNRFNGLGFRLVFSSFSLAAG
jgi:sulfatase modifying factor 1